MEDAQKKTKISVAKESENNLPETFDSWTVITGSMSKPTESENTQNFNEINQNLNDPEPSTSGIESLTKDEKDTPSDTNLENTDELSDGISIIEEDSDSLGRHTPLNIFSSEDYLINRENLYASERFTKTIINSSNENINEDEDEDDRRSFSLKNGISGFFCMGVFFAVIAFLAKLKYPEWNDTVSINARITDIELQNNLLRAELDILTKELNYIKNRGKNINNYNNNNLKDEMKFEIDKKKIKVWPGAGDMRPTKIDKDDLKQPYKLDVTDDIVWKSFNKARNDFNNNDNNSPKKMEKLSFEPDNYLNIDFDDWTYREYVTTLLKSLDYDIDYKLYDILSIDIMTYDRLSKFLAQYKIAPIDKEQFQNLIDNFRAKDQYRKIITAESLIEERYPDSEQQQRRDKKILENFRTLDFEQLRNFYIMTKSPEIKLLAEKVFMEKLSKIDFFAKSQYNEKIEFKLPKKKKESKERNFDTIKDKKYNNNDDIIATKDKNKDKKDWHENYMRERENSRKRKNDFNKQKNNWYSERGQAREQARVN